MDGLARCCFVLSLALPVAASASGLVDYPGGRACDAERTEAYKDGYLAGYDVGYPEGYAQGFIDRAPVCAADPKSCGVTLAACVPDATYGETEPNDNLITADPLTLEANFWAQLYGAEDQDWFWTESDDANQNLIVNFSVPEWLIDEAQGQSLVNGDPAIWNVSVRDAAGNVFANFNTNVPGGIESTAYSVTYNVTLGLEGTYYLVVKPVEPGQGNAYSYAIAAFLQDTDLDNDQWIAGFYDSEIEPNDWPANATRLATGVSMYGLINLTFNQVVPDPEDPEKMQWAQGESDWFVYRSNGNEIITLVMCAREECAAGDWLLEVYDRATASAIEAGASREQVVPLLAANTDNTDDPTATYRLGLEDADDYFLRISHKRLLSAPCAGYLTDANNDGLVGPDPQSCACPDGEYSCGITIPNPGEMIIVEEDVWPRCPGSGEREEDCIVDCSCETPEGGQKSCVIDGLVVDDPETGEPYTCSCPGFLESCQNIITQPEPEYVEEIEQYPLCPDGSGGGDDPQCNVGCVCSAFSGVVEIPENTVTSPYNFTWHGTQLPPNTIDTDAYDDYLDRENPYGR